MIIRVRYVVAAFLIAALSILCLSSCSNTSSDQSQMPQYVSPYDWEHGLIRDGEKLIYVEDDEIKSKWGIDVSEHQHWIDWQKVNSAGVEFAFIRIGNRGATQGNLSMDDYFLYNAVSATAVGIETDAYFFSQALNEDEAIEEANFVLQLLRSAELQGASFNSIAYDHESVSVEGARANDVSGEQLRNNARAFCETIENAGYKAYIYGNQRDLLKMDVEIQEDYPIWYAEYDVDIPTAPFDFEIWQYSNSGSIPGISTNVDLNLKIL